MHRQRRRSLPDHPEDLNVWVSFTDLMSGSVLIFGLLLSILLMHIGSRQQRPRFDAVPPIILIPDNEAFRFQVGSAELSAGLRRYVWEDLAEAIANNRRRYGIDTVEIIGHTDGQPNQGVTSNLDLLLETAAVTHQLGRLQPGSNVDLGLMRALAIANELRKVQAAKRELRGLGFRAYSAGQLYLPTGELAPPDRGNDRGRRRIEVRFTRLGRVMEATGR